MINSILLIHSSHTDLGYTDLPHRIIQRQVDYLHQAVDQVQQNPRFIWTCETFQIVEAFWQLASPSQRETFLEAVRNGQMGLSANYLNFTELATPGLLRRVAERVSRFAQEHALSIATAMTADINGLSWAYARALSENGVDNLFTCVHTHHGMFPLSYVPRAFDWDLGENHRLRVWSGFHYHLGNELGLMPDAVIPSYTIRDSFHAGETHRDLAERRIPALLQALEEQEYPFDFVPIVISGLATDNGPPNADVLKEIDWWNDAHGDTVTIQMASPDTLFARMNAITVSLPVYSGLWPDWWNDFSLGTPVSLSLFRQTLRRGERVRLWDASRNHPELSEQLDDHLVRYAEHTFGHSATSTQPCDPLVRASIIQKEALAVSAMQTAEQLEDQLALEQGGWRYSANRPASITVFNPFDCRFEGIASVEWDAALLPTNLSLVLTDTESNKNVSVQSAPGLRGEIYYFPVNLAPREYRTLSVDFCRETPSIDFRIRSTQPVDTSSDIFTMSDTACGEFFLQTRQVRIEWDEGGIRSWVDRKNNRSLLDTASSIGPGTPVYEITPGADRSSLGRNRKGIGVQRDYGRLNGVDMKAAGHLFTTVRLNYSVKGCREYTLDLTAYHDHPRVDMTVNLHKTSTRDPENLFIALPFSPGLEADFFLDAMPEGARPWLDQIPGTGCDYYACNDGFVRIHDGYAVAVGMPDTPMLQVGSLAAAPRLLAGMPELANRTLQSLAWVMSNVWETNANIDLGGFYRFNYHILWSDSGSRPARIFKDLQRLHMGIPAYLST